MKISEYSDILDSIKPTGYAYRAQMRAAYNANNKVEPVFLFVPPRSWAVKWRNHCSHEERTQLMLGLPVNLKLEGKQQWANYSPIEAREALIDLAAQIMKDLNEVKWVRVVSSGIERAEFYDATEGHTANQMVWLSWFVDVELFEFTGITYNGTPVLYDNVFVTYKT